MEEISLSLVRHLPTDWNEAGKLQGRADRSILDPSVRKQLAAVDDDVEKVFCSSLQRTGQTASVFGFGERVEINPDLDEWDFGEWEGRQKADLATLPEWREAPDQLKMGEPFGGLTARVARFYRGLCEADERSVLVFGHGAWIRCFLAIFRSGNPLEMNLVEVQNGEANRVQLRSPADHFATYFDSVSK
ncbi:MAG: histidine phosphatase family protein [Verrucomicrobiales bacterium]|nr:histidine phosphatase family protein [Verrucomicrobiales bacterium]